MSEKRRPWRLKALAGTFVVLLAFAAGIGLTRFYQHKVQEMRPVSISEALFKSDNDKLSFARLSEVMTIVEEEYHEEVTGDRLFSLFLTGVGGLDPHSSYITPEQVMDAAQAHDGSFGGVGIEIMRSANPRLPGIMVVAPIEDGPAEKAGVRAKDLIVEILVPGKDGGNVVWRSTAKMTPREATSLLRGPLGTTVEFKVYREGAIELLPFKIERVTIVMRSIRSELKPDGVGYIKLARFDESLAYQRTPFERAAAWGVIEVIEKLKKKNGDKQLSGLVLDLGNNPGGHLDVVEAILNLFLEKSRYQSRDAATMLSTEHRGVRTPEMWVKGEKDILEGAPILVLINEGSASASEIAAGVLQKHGRGIVAGVTKSFGKGTVQVIVPLHTGGQLHLTASQYLVGSVGCEQAVQNGGITPDIYLKRSEGDPEPSAPRRESNLEGALETSKVAPTNCQHHFAVSAAHKAAAYQMLKIMGLDPVQAQ